MFDLWTERGSEDAQPDWLKGVSIYTCQKAISEIEEESDDSE